MLHSVQLYLLLSSPRPGGKRARRAVHHQKKEKGEESPGFTTGDPVAESCHIRRNRCAREKQCRRPGNKSLAHGGGTALAEVGLLGLGFGDTLGKDGGVLVLVALLALNRVSSGVGEHTAASLVLSALRRLRAMRWRLCWRRWGVTRRWILGALVYGFLPSHFG
jgi:hypothetical protein